MLPWNGSCQYMNFLENVVLEGSRMLHKRHNGCRSITKVICAGLLVSASNCGWSLSTTHAQTTVQFGVTSPAANGQEGDANQGFSVDFAEQPGFSFRSVPPIDAASPSRSDQQVAPPVSSGPLTNTQGDSMRSDLELDGWEVPSAGKQSASSNRSMDILDVPATPPSSIESMVKGKPGDDSFRILKENKPAPQSQAQEPVQTTFEPTPQQANDGKIGLVAFTQDAQTVPAEDQENAVERTFRPNDANGIPGLKGEVKVLRDPVTGDVTLIGSDEDIALVAKELQDLMKQTPKATGERILLNNISSDEIAETVQEIYDANFAPSQGQASVRPLRSPNSLYVFGSKDAIESVRSIVEKIDSDATPKSGEDGPFATFRLQHISAVDAKIRLDGYFGQAESGGGENKIPSDPVTTVADFRSNVLIVRGAKQYLDQAEKLIRAIDVDDGGSTDVVRIFQLKNTLAEEIAPVLQDAVSGQQANAGQGYTTNQNAQQQNQPGQADATSSTLKSGNLRLKAIGSDGQEVSGGITFGVRITADSNSNSLVVRGPESSMPLIEELILQLDRLPDAETLIKVFAVENGDAQSLLLTLQSLFNSDQNQQGQFGNQTGSTNSLPLQSASATQGASLVNLRFSIDERTNSIIATGPAGDLRVVEDLINRLDETSLNRRQPVVYRLSNSPVLDVQEALQAWLDGRDERNGDDPRTSPSVALADRDVNVTAEVVSNSLIIDATPQYLPEIMEVIERLDRRPPMVKVKVMIAEVDLNALEEFGVEVGVQDSLLFSRGSVLGLNPPAIPAGAPQFPETLAGQALTSFGTGRVSSTSGQSGLVLSAGNESIDILVRALKQRSALRVLSKPHVVTLENLQGKVVVGQLIPRIVGSTQNQIGGGIQNVVEDVEVGVILEMTPRVSPDGMIVLFVDAQKSSLATNSAGVAVAVGQDGTAVVQQPINTTQAQTTIMARSGQTVAFTGLIQETKGHAEVGIPVLSDLPLVGPLFKFESDTAQRTELLIIMTPYLVDGEEEVEIQNQDEMDRMHWCLCDVAEVYGKTDYNSYEYQDGAVETIYPDQGFGPVASPQSVDNFSPSVNGPEMYQYGSPQAKTKATPLKTKRKFEFNPLKRFVRQASSRDDRDGQAVVNQADYETPSQTQRQK